MEEGIQPCGTSSGRRSPRDKRMEIALTLYLRHRPYPLPKGDPRGDRHRPGSAQQGPHRRPADPAARLHRSQPQGRGRPAPRGSGRHPSQDRDRLLPGLRHRRGLPVSRSADQDQRAYPQGPEAHHRRQEEGRQPWHLRRRPRPAPRRARLRRPAAGKRRTSRTAPLTSRARSTTPSSPSPTPGQCHRLGVRVTSASRFA